MAGSGGMAGVLGEMAGSGGEGGVWGGWRIAPLTRGLVVVDVDSLQLERRVTHVASGRVDAMFVADHFPKLAKGEEGDRRSARVPQGRPGGRGAGSGRQIPGALEPLRGRGTGSRAGSP